MKSLKLNQGSLVRTPDGIGIVVKSGVRELVSLKGTEWEEVVLVIVDQDPKWYNVLEVQLLKSGRRDS